MAPWAAIYLGPSLPMGSSHLLRAAGPALCSPAVLLRIEFTAAFCPQTPGELLPRLSTLTALNAAVFLCCTCPEVAFGGRYPLSLPYGARTFLVSGLSAHLPRLPSLLMRTLGVFYAICTIVSNKYLFAKMFLVYVCGAQILLNYHNNSADKISN